jgi:hypothetical protein
MLPGSYNRVRGKSLSRYASIPDRVNRIAFILCAEPEFFVPVLQFQDSVQAVPIVNRNPFADPPDIVAALKAIHKPKRSGPSVGLIVSMKRAEGQ